MYYSGATQGSSGHQLNADVIWAGDLASAYAGYQQELSGSETITPLSGVGVRAFTTPDTVVVDYGGLVITVNDSAQLADPLDVDQLRFVVAEIQRIYG